MPTISVGQALYTKNGDKLKVTAIWDSGFEVEYNGYRYKREEAVLGSSIFIDDPVQAAKQFTGVRDETFLLEADHLKETRQRLESFRGFLQGVDFAPNGVAIGASYGFNEYSKEKILSSPYFARMDMQDELEKDTMQVYVGKKGVYYQGEMLICDWRSKAGQFYYLKNQNQYQYNGYTYFLQLRRQLEVAEGNLVSYEDEYVRTDLGGTAGLDTTNCGGFSPQFSSAPQSDRIADPFLQKVLQKKHQQNELTDIIVSIQENQNEIIQADPGTNLIIQGCAGSGKTMILLHRLSFLKYRYKGLDSSEIKIITPNSLFNHHIDELSTSLEIEKIEKLTVEEYYAVLIARYTQSERSSMPAKQNTRDRASRKAAIAERDCADAESLYDDEIVEKTIQYARRAAREATTVELKFAKVNEILRRNGYRELAVEGEPVPRLVGAAITYLNSILESLEDYAQQRREYESSKERFEEVSRKLSDKKAGLDRADDLIEEVAGRIAAGNKRVQDTYTQQLSRLQRQQDAYQKELQRPLPPSRKQILHNHTADIRRQIEETEFCLLAADMMQAKRVKEYDEKKLQKVGEETSFCGEDLDTLTDALNLAKSFQMTDIIQKVIKKLCGASTGLSVRNREFLSLWVYFTVMGPLRDGESMLCIDEGQDISVNEYRLLHEINGSKVCFNVYGDTEQLIKSHGGISDWEQLSPVFSFSRYNLFENYRNTAEIIDYCNGELRLAMTNIGIPGDPVNTVSYRNLVTHLNQLLIGSRRAAILGSEKEMRDLLTLQGKIHHKLHRQDILPGDIALLTPKESKGLEFDVCYVLPGHLTRNERYIACTRALSELYIVREDAAAD